jgi:hypothetical protein
MKTITRYHKKSDVVSFKRVEKDNGEWFELTYDEKGNELSYKNSEGFCYECTVDEFGNILTYKNSEGGYIIGREAVSKEEFESFNTNK